MAMVMAMVSVRLDVVSVAMLVLVACIGAVVLRYAATCLRGEKRRGVFLAWLGLTLGAVLLLVVAGSTVLLGLAWVATSLCLHRLLLFYPERPGARRLPTSSRS